LPRSICHRSRSWALSNQRIPGYRRSGVSSNREFILEAGSFLRDSEDAKRVVVAASGGKPVYLRDVAEVVDGGEESTQYVQYSTGRGFEPAVTIAIAKRKSTNAVDVSKSVLAKVDALKGSLIPNDVELTITRNYGETAAEKSNELLFHMGIAVVSVSILIALVLGWRESWIVFIAIPVTLALTLTVFYLYGYTLNRITLFALIFSIGYWWTTPLSSSKMSSALPSAWQPRPAIADVAVEAVDEVGNPTILATLAVIAAILPMAFVSGLMGPTCGPSPSAPRPR